MKKLIIYDESCPMCRAYTKGMVAMDTTGNLIRTGSGQLTDKTLLSRIDRQRAKHEIPMIDLGGGETLYGVDTWAYAFGRQSRRFMNLLSFRWFNVLLRTLYAFISYNRRIIITAAPGRWQLLDLQPEFRLGYRSSFILLVFGLVGGLHYAAVGSFDWPVIGLVSGQIGLVSLYLFLTKQADFTQTLLDYCGHLGMSLLLGGLFIAASLALKWPVGVLIGSALTISQHFIRTYRLGLNPWLSATFTVLYLLVVTP